jgi:hypothetical protein
MYFLGAWVRKYKRLSNQLVTTVFMIFIPVVHKVAESRPGSFSLADFLKGKMHGLQYV